MGLWSLTPHVQGCQDGILQDPSPGAVYIAWTGAGGCQQCQYLGWISPATSAGKTHVDRITSNTNRSLGFSKRSVKTSPLTSEKWHRPQLEYASAVWYPATKDKTLKVEMVKRRATQLRQDD